MTRALVKVGKAAQPVPQSFTQRLLGLFGINRPAKVPPTQALGSGGTTVVGGFISSREKSPDLQGTLRFRTFHDLMVNTSIVAASVRYFLGLVSAVEWKVKPSTKSKNKVRAEQVAEAFEAAITDKSMTIPWRRVCRRAAMFRFHGFGLQEWTARRRPDGWVGFAGIEARPQHTIEQFDVDDAGRVVGFVQRHPVTFLPTYLPRSKLIYMVDDALDDSPIGTGLMRHVVEPARQLRRLVQLEGYGYETDLQGTPVIRAPLDYLNRKVAEGPPNGITGAQRDAILAELEAFSRHHVLEPARAVMLDSLAYPDVEGNPTNVPMYALDTLKAEATSQVPIGAAILRLEHDVARILGTEMLLMGATPNGTQALAKVKMDVLALTANGVNADMADQFEADLIRPWGNLNGVAEEDLPDLEPDDVQLRDVEQIGAVLEHLARAGAPLGQDDPAVNAVRRLAGVPDAPELDLGMMGVAGQGLPGQQAKPGVPADDGDLNATDEVDLTDGG